MIDGIKCVEQVITDDYAIYQGDSCEVIRAIPGDSIHFGIHSPPFEGLYKFSNFDRDISNSEGPGFWEHYGFLISELLRVTMPGRIHAVHVMQVPTSKIRHGHIGMRDFRGEVVRAYEDAGWIFHSEVCIWKDPVVAQQRSKSIRLLHKQIVKDSSISGQGLAEYIRSFRKPTHPGKIPYLHEMHYNDIQMVTELMVDHIDECRFYPLVGPAQLHHCHYRVTVYYETLEHSSKPFSWEVKQDDSNIVYIDKDHLHICVSPEMDEIPESYRDVYGAYNQFTYDSYGVY